MAELIQNNKEVSIETNPMYGPQGPQGPQGYTPYIGENDNWWINGEDTGKTSRGLAGPQGEPGPAGPAGADGAVGPAGPAGADGATLPANIVDITDLSNLATNTMYSLVPNSVELALSLPEVQDQNVSNIIVIQADFSSLGQPGVIDWGDSCIFYEGIIPVISEATTYDITLVYHKINQKWAVKCLKVG